MGEKGKKNQRGRKKKKKLVSGLGREKGERVAEPGDAFDAVERRSALQQLTCH